MIKQINKVVITYDDGTTKEFDATGFHRISNSFNSDRSGSINGMYYTAHEVRWTSDEKRI